MSVRPPIPDLLIGIDFGMTYTGVAWTNFAAPGSQVISDWPGAVDDDGKKVPTRMVYSPYNTVEAWGYQLNHVRVSPPSRTLKWWKIFLDQDKLNEAWQNGLEDIPRTVAEAQQMVTSYLHEVYGHIKESIQAEAGRGWAEKTILFNFSLPTTWTSLATVENFKNAIANAGFGAENPLQHTAELELTEAEAAAVFTLKEAQIRFQNEDILLICDAGGGTTDIGLFQVKQASDPLSLVQINQVQGIGIGATLIDRGFANLIKQRLNQAPDVQARLPRGLPEMMADSLAFRTLKHSFGSGLGNHEQFYIPSVASDDLIPSNYSDARLGIEYGRMVFSRAEIQALFDEQIIKIIRKIDQQLKWMQGFRGSEQIKYLILSGGFGSSTYLRHQLESRYRLGAHPNATNMSIIRAKFPQLAVVKGLVMDKTQKLELGTSLLKCRVARRSYGVVCKEEYNPLIHIGEDTVADEYIPKKRWAKDQIDWIIRKGDAIAADSAPEHPFNRKLKPGDPTRTWNTTIVVSDNEASQLPISLKRGGAMKLCAIQASLTGVHQREFQEYNKRCWQKGKHHFLVSFTVKVVVGPADLKFELWFKGGKYSNPHDPVRVQWDMQGLASKPVEIDNSGWERGRGLAEMS